MLTDNYDSITLTELIDRLIQINKQHDGLDNNFVRSVNAYMFGVPAVGKNQVIACEKIILVLEIPNP